MFQANEPTNETAQPQSNKHVVPKNKNSQARLQKKLKAKQIQVTKQEK